MIEKIRTITNIKLLFSVVKSSFLRPWNSHTDGKRLQLAIKAPMTCKDTGSIVKLGFVFEKSADLTGWNGIIQPHPILELRSRVQVIYGTNATSDGWLLNYEQAGVLPYIVEPLRKSLQCQKGAPTGLVGRPCPRDTGLGVCLFFQQCCEWLNTFCSPRRQKTFETKRIPRSQWVRVEGQRNTIEGDTNM